MEMKKGIAKSIVNTLGRVGIRVNNLSGHAVGAFFITYGISGFAGRLFDNHIWRH